MTRSRPYTRNARGAAHMPNLHALCAPLHPPVVRRDELPAHRAVREHAHPSPDRRGARVRAVRVALEVERGEAL